MVLGRNTRAELLLSLVPHLRPAIVPGVFLLRVTLPRASMDLCTMPLTPF